MLKSYCTGLRRQRGITLLESLVAMVVAALSILGILGVQMRTLTDTQTTVRRAQAIRLIEDLGERMKVNPNALADINTYTSGFANEPTPGSCSSGCDHGQLAAYDLAVWKKTVKSTLPLGQASVFLAPGEGAGANANRRQLGVIISWRENERDTGSAYKDNIDASKVLAANGTAIAATDAANACPADRTCHLQYLPVAARCAPYFASTTVQYHCPGS
ncbi:MAG: type pilus modification protein PilV [Polaromonas sp.]|jgi:type IV pilus assembly protein PilV|nr:type pilus modification protein PilV [Polaromonas sp.]